MSNSTHTSNNDLRVAVLVSGQGSTLMSIVNSVINGILPINLVGVVSNKSKQFHSGLINLVEHTGINIENINYSDFQNRNEFEKRLHFHLMTIRPDLIVLAGWDLVLPVEIINSFSNIINLHPALPNTFRGLNCIKLAYEAYQRGEIQYTGSMVHKVVEEVDAGEVISSVVVNILPNDTYEDLEQRVKYHEKGLIVSAIQHYVELHNRSLVSSNQPYIGKVRKVSDIGYGMLLMSASNRLSAFDRHMCDINNKGYILNHISKWWFQNTEHIIENHYIYAEDNHMLVRKTEPIKLEFIVRGYMTGSTSTSIWPMYKDGNRTMYGLHFRDGYQKNEKLDHIILTPTTKGVSDHPITLKEIIDEGLLTEEELDYVATASRNLFTYGQEEAAKRGLILVDTKYEFGKVDGKIILIDEVHTCDSSRYWKADSYQSRFDLGLEPEKYDKDCVRDWVKKNCDPYNDPIPEIPSDVIKQVEDVYSQYYSRFMDEPINNSNISEELVVSNYFDNIHQSKVVILSGSQSDMKHNLKIQTELKKKGIYSRIHVSSAHKNTRQVLDILERYNQFSGKLVYVTVAGMSNALSGVVSCNTQFPVIACPPHADKDDMMVNIQSTLQCPSNVPAMAILRPDNVALAISKIFAL